MPCVLRENLSSGRGLAVQSSQKKMKITGKNMTMHKHERLKTFFWPHDFISENTVFFRLGANGICRCERNM